MTDERENDPPREGDRARHAAEHPLGTAETPATGEEKMVRRRLTAPIVIGAIAVIVLLVVILL